jgi:peptide/nickel transport system ATP-binding protein/oligopeptide transport system ATP-binding protein
MPPLLSLRGLRVSFPIGAQRVTVVDDVSFDVGAGETVCLVGESGSGKSITALSVLGLVSEPGRIDAGEIRFAGEDLRRADAATMYRVRGGEIGMIFQEPMTSLNPLFTVGEQIGEGLRIHEGLSRGQARSAAVDLLRRVGIASAGERVDQHPHEMSGGMRQRVMIAMALACRPKLLIADEPTTALDVTIQAQILELLMRLREELGMAVIFITHDMGVVARIAERVVVMYAGRVAEDASVRRIFAHPAHPYTEALLRCIPSMDEDNAALHYIEGTVPSPVAMPPGCRFAPRCPQAQVVCTTTAPPLYTLPGGQRAACVLQAGRALAEPVA